jgi:putative ATPase
MRCSDPDAAVYWMMRMVSAGEDPLFILRRLIVFASEEIGNADPRSLSVAVDADRAFRRLGLPEGLHALSQAVTYLASAPKSNAASLAWQRAREALDDHGALPVPLRLRRPAAALLQDGGKPGGPGPVESSVARVMEGDSCLPESLLGARFYRPTMRGLERHIVERLRRLRSAGGGGDEGDEG